MKHTWLCSKNGKGMAASIGLHVLFLALVYFKQLALEPRMSNGQAYTISLKPESAYTVSEKDASPIKEAVKEYAIPGVKSPMHKPSKRINHSKRRFRPRQQKQGQQGASPAKAAQKVAQGNKTPKIDARGLYNLCKGRTKQAGATLELTGWEWDTVPNPKDTTEECGKIVFEVKVDENGEIIAIQTIEKTITPMVEKIYLDALRGLTFSKTSEIQSYPSVSTGRVSFILVAK